MTAGRIAIAGCHTVCSPPSTEGAVAGFEITRALGEKGTGSMDRATALAIAAVGDLLDDAPAAADATTGIVLGTTSGSASAQWQFTQQSHTRRRPYQVDPALMPFALMNSAAARCAMWYRLTGPNTTLANGRVSTLSGLRYARRLLLSDRADRLVCGGVEEYSEQRVRLQPADTALAEGCGVLLLQRADDGPALAEVLAIRCRVALDGDVGRTVAHCAEAALRDAGVAAPQLRTVSPSDCPGEPGALERQALTELTSGVPEVRWTEPAADYGAASAALQIAAVLAAAPTTPTLALVSSVDPDGAVVCALLAVRPHPN